MMDSQPDHGISTIKVQCWPARIVGVIGLFVILWFGAYAVQDIPTNLKMIPLTIFWSLMLIGGCVDIFLVGREGKGGLLITVGGIASYIFILLWLFLGQDREWIVPAIMGTSPLLISGLMFYFCGKRRKKLRE
jgi:peptidoglycan/LPS O-acetylase OafA/YrhL